MEGSSGQRAWPEGAGPGGRGTQGCSRAWRQPATWPLGTELPQSPTPRPHSPQGAGPRPHRLLPAVRHGAGTRWRVQGRGQAGPAAHGGQRCRLSPSRAARWPRGAAGRGTGRRSRSPDSLLPLMQRGSRELPRRVPGSLAGRASAVHQAQREPLRATPAHAAPSCPHPATSLGSARSNTQTRGAP